jgi:hypothetical protein
MTGTLDRMLPDYAHGDGFSTTVAVAPAVVWDALHRVTPAEMALARTLMALRGVPARLLNERGPGWTGDPDVPVLDRLGRFGFSVLHEDPPTALAAGAIGRPWRLGGDDHPVPTPTPELFAAFSEPGFVRMALAFDLEPVEAGTRLRTETRVAPTDAGAARAFRRYWLAIRPGSALIRLDLLRATRRRAERDRSHRPPTA